MCKITQQVLYIVLNYLDIIQLVKIYREFSHSILGDISKMVIEKRYRSKYFLPTLLKFRNYSLKDVFSEISTRILLFDFLYPEERFLPIISIDSCIYKEIASQVLSKRYSGQECLEYLLRCDTIVRESEKSIDITENANNRIILLGENCTANFCTNTFNTVVLRLEDDYRYTPIFKVCRNGISIMGCKTIFIKTMDKEIINLKKINDDDIQKKLHNEDIQKKLHKLCIKSRNNMAFH